MDDLNKDFYEIIRIMQSMTKNQQSVDPYRFSAMDQLVNNQQLRILKASLPYFDYPLQKNIATLVKLIELKRTFDFYNEPIEIHEAKMPKKEVNKLEILSELRNYCDEPYQKKINSILMLLNLQKTLQENKNNPKLLSSQDDTSKNESDNDDQYFQFMNMMNRIIKEKEEDK